METVKFECDCDRVIEMEEMKIGVGEILQYAHGVFRKEDLQSLIEGLEKLASNDTFATDDFDDEE